MEDEWVLVVFPDNRAVNVDDGRLGTTNNKFIVQRGTHIFDLGDPKNYTPPSIERTVVGTDEDNPMIIVFMGA